VNERQRDQFLFLWSRRRAPGAMRIALRGAVIGGLGGLAFAWIMLSGGAHTPGVHAYDFAGQLGSAVRLVALSVAAFAAIGWGTARRVWASQERMYHSLLEAGARVPEQKPILTMADRGPALAVAIVAVVIAAFILYLLWAASTGNL
jgi:hypothetical protein